MTRTPPRAAEPAVRYRPNMTTAYATLTPEQLVERRQAELASAQDRLRSAEDLLVQAARRLGHAVAQLPTGHTP